MEKKVQETGKPKKPRKRRGDTTPELTALRHRMYAKYIAPHHNMIRYWLQKHTSNHEMVDDYYAEMLRDFYLYIDTYDEKKDVIPWIIVAMQRKISYFHKRDRREQERKMGLSEHYVSKTMPDLVHSDTVDSLDFDVVREHIQDDMLAALQELTPECRSAFLLRASGYQPKDIAEREYQGEGEVPPACVEDVRARIRFVRKFLKSRLNRDGSAKRQPGKEEAFDSGAEDSYGHECLEGTYEPQAYQES